MIQEQRFPIVVTDLTAFREGKVCIAGISPDNGLLVRPLPYQKQDWVERNKVRPGTVLVGSFSRIPDCTPPHIEDYYHKGLQIHMELNKEAFLDLLRKYASSGVAAGFGVPMPHNEKGFPEEGDVPKISIITVEAVPSSLELRISSFDNKMDTRLSFTDASGQRFNSVKVTGIAYAPKRIEERLSDMNKKLKASRAVYLRIGVGRPFQGKYWLQVNGIHPVLEGH